jgi:hypothetical protein
MDSRKKSTTIRHCEALRFAFNCRLDTRIRVHEATNEKIIYTIERDEQRYN